MSDSVPPHGLQPSRLLCPWDFLGKNTGAGFHFLLQGDLPIPEIKPMFLAHLLLAGEFFTTEPLGEPKSKFYWFKSYIVQFTSPMTVSFYIQTHTQSGNSLFGAYKSFVSLFQNMQMRVSENRLKCHKTSQIKEHSEFSKIQCSEFLQCIFWNVQFLTKNYKTYKETGKHDPHSGKK